MPTETKKIITAKDETSRPPSQSPSQNATASKPKQLRTAAAATANLNPNNKRARSSTEPSPPSSSSPSETKTGPQYNNVTTKQQSIEMITQKEAMHHVDMAWRAQQRLVRRCLGLRLFSVTQTGNINDDCNKDDAEKQSNTAKT
mmetsp:Transcript_38418/g.81959  ORF Transcript_38418/g.81959 Transcript_38418/m.81959 type:complete len:144 (-) Transcript_38418:1206-1637(-)|eukprot:CAMPEP_0172543104 /NCGR_PEP_ID=MMETSP1067-20121228/13576_2 /TAXON_ID=265564 ORGANISM="Thalassiosira punctigera, Strain Tpunct2005C2" /NCGR_SAMPLE_ID=MMETSP1067 /ASSEMBLY_ACC=CAM_ASM_000444 /LENGTH=143 /DNA_ID=CAMNT_0013329447 /DNA_START=99 /DNA_END=530 /DNA_ORIENTATION=-